ncbi:uncharacterized protein K460DRAFT_298271 [Cucurbitaria berberidis CBS 394.84]|uniref:RRM domain-containing protein n=1 Tax=Cucurbitaria berberidis CBS 394.84 TaxID=1168544 RepID=A0A9P4GND2_9PLEO|nr:uncharacterized protein K460DRAFT_298271 [Cucurbitaria berberidis CBS 394.84]KAF1849648.1 hypothetical protein K460DRAFT_298271 [Cucurbitaria berberidis CBS 394.84]
MAAPRILLRSRCPLSRGITTSRLSRSVLPSISTTFTQRSLTSSARSWQDIVHTPATGPEPPRTESPIVPTEYSKRSIVFLTLPKRAVRSDIEALLRSKGCDIKRIQLRLDRFTFQNDTMCFVELGSENQVSEAVQTLNGSVFLNKKVVVRPAKEDFTFGHQRNLTNMVGGSRYFYQEGTSAYEAGRPLIEGRRMMLCVQTPGWGAKDMVVSTRNKNAMSIIDQYFGKYGIETLGALHNFYGDKKENPRLLCFLDFKTKEGADQAVAELHDTEIEGRRTWLKISEPAPWRAHQIGKVDEALLTELQEKGLAPRETYNDKFLTPKKKTLSAEEKGM